MNAHAPGGPPADTIAINRIVLGNFKLLEVLGQGAFAAAYLADQVGTDRKAVVKIAHPHLLRSGQADLVRKRFASEVRAATRVSHPNLVIIYTAGETEEGLPALAMEHLEGETLGQRLRRGGRLDVEELVRGFAQLASALSHVHSNRIVHRDVSPENVFLSHMPGGFAVKLLDFGIAHLQDLPTSTKYTMIGTPFYVALEQLRGSPTTASDVYSVGALLWWSLTGSEIYSHVGQFTELLYILETQREPPNPRVVCPTMPQKLATLVGSMLHHQPTERPTMSEFLQAWTELEPVIRSWWAARSSRLVGLVMDTTPDLQTLTRGLQSEGHRVVRLEPRISAILTQKDLDAIVIDAELSEPDPISLARYLANVLPDVGLFAVSSRPFAAAWFSERLRVCALLPEQLPLLTESIGQDELAPASKRGADSREFSRRALGEIPELLARLEESVTNFNGADTAHLCELIERISHLAELKEMGSLARTLRVLLEQQAVDDPQGFVDQMTRSFGDSFPALLAAQEN